MQSYRRLGSRPKSIAVGLSLQGAYAPTATEADLIDFSIPQQLKMIVEALGSFLRQEVDPRERDNVELFENPAATYGPDGRLVPDVLQLAREVRMASAKAGYYNLTVPEELGGSGEGYGTLFHAFETLHHEAGPGRILPYQTIAHWAVGPSRVMLGATAEARHEVVSRLVSGEDTSCFALSEPDAGSDVYAMKTRAVRDGDGWVINGQKQWITNAPYAHHALIFVVTDQEQLAQHTGGISCFLVDTDWPGFSVDSVIRLYGHNGGEEGILSFTDLRVPQSRLVGELHKGMELALGGISTGRLYNCARSIGWSRWAVERATVYATQRTSFGKPIAEYQAIQWLLADSAIEIYAGRMMAINAAWRLDQGESAVKFLSMAKVFCTEAGSRILDRCMQVFGGIGLTNEAKLFDAWQRLRTVRIADGSAEILRRTVANRLLEGDHDV